MSPLTRRSVLLSTASLIAAPPAWAGSLARSLASDITDAALRFLETAPEGARFELQSEEATRWHWTNVRRFPRSGMRLREMNAEQRAAALALLDASLSPTGAGRARMIMALETLIGRDSEDYFWSVFGMPGDAHWGWRLEGHHLSHHFRISGERVSAMPFFLGAWPNATDTGQRPLGRVEDMALDLVAGLSPEAQRTAIMADRARPGHVTGNAVVARVPALQGLRLAEAGGDAAGRAIAAAYLQSLPTEEAAAALARLDQAGTDQLYLSWRGPLDIDSPHYWRLQGPSFVLEWDDTLNHGNHIHSVWRDHQTDFGTAIT